MPPPALTAPRGRAHDLRDEPHAAVSSRCSCSACCCLLPPLLRVFNRPVRILGMPVLYLYLFVAWAALIGMTAAVVRLDRSDAHATEASRCDAPSDACLRSKDSRDA